MPFKIIRNDITKVKADAIVNTANPNPIIGGGTDSAIYAAAGSVRLLKDRQKIGTIAPGNAEITKAYKLDAKYIIHVVGPVWIDGNHNERDILRSSYEASLNRAMEYKCKSIAFPLISSGVYGFPKEEALDIAISAISHFLMKEEMLVYLVVFDNKAFELSGNLFTDVEAFIDENYVADKQLKEYRIRRCISSRILPSVCDFSDECELPEDYEDDEYEEIVEHNAQCTVGSVKEADKSSESDVQNVYRQRSLEDIMDQVGESFQQRLLRLIDERGLTDVEVYKKANLDRKLFSKIRCNENYKPKKKTAIAFAIALQLNLDETKDLLARAELALSPSNKFDLIIQYFIVNEIYDVYKINLALFKHEQQMLGE